MTISYYEKVGDKVCCIDGELPFKIPKKWAWCRAGNLISVVSGVTYNKADIQEQGIRILRGGNLTHDNKIVFQSDDIFLPESYFNFTNEVHKGDIIVVASTGSSEVIGKPAFAFDGLEQVQIGGFLRILRPIKVNLLSYLRLIFLSSYYKRYITQRAKGTNINNIKADYLQDLLIPLPPPNELSYIVRYFNSTESQILTIEKSLK